MASDMFLELNKIKGESHDSKYKGDIDVLSWSWGMSNDSTAHVGGGAGAGKANIQNISITKYIDRASVTLMEHVATGKHIDKAKLVVRKSGGKALEYCIIELKKVFVSSYTTGGSGAEVMLTESIVLNFEEVKVTYVPQKADGSGDAKVDFGFNILENKKK